MYYHFIHKLFSEDLCVILSCQHAQRSVGSSCVIFRPWFLFWNACFQKRMHIQHCLLAELDTLVLAEARHSSESSSKIKSNRSSLQHWASVSRFCWIERKGNTSSGLCNIFSLDIDWLRTNVLFTDYIILTQACILWRIKELRK